MKKYLMVTTILAVLGSTVLLLSPVATSVLAQDTPHSEEYMQQHDGGDRAEYLQEMENSDPSFYVPPVNEASMPPTVDDLPAN
jgi:hypothetical protein